MLSAEMRNIPPSISGDLDLSVDKGKAVRITPQDLSAIDPDDAAAQLTFTVSQVHNGFVTLATDPARPIEVFTQADLEQGTVLFRHDGTDEPRALVGVLGPARMDYARVIPLVHLFSELMTARLAR